MVVVVVVVVEPPLVPGMPGAGPGPTISPGRMKRQRPCFVIGSLYACRRNLPFTSTSSDGGRAFPFRFW